MELLRSSLRQLRAHAGFSTLVITLLALGIGANTAIFGIVDAVLLRPLPYPEPGDLVWVRKPSHDPATTLPGGGDMMPDNEFMAWTEAAPKSFRALAAYRNGAATLQRGDGAVRVPSANVTRGFFPLLGVGAWRGRLFADADLQPGAAPTAVLSYSAWESRFNGDDQAVGQVVQLDDTPTTIIGVLPPAFEFTDPVQFWRPLITAPGEPGQLRIQLVRVFGRLLPGTAIDTARRELDDISGRFWDNLSAGFGGGPPGAGAPGPRRVVSGPGPDLARGPGGPGFRLPFADNPAQPVPLQEQLAHQSRLTLWLLLGAVSLVLLIACANIANLQLARASSRRRDCAIRAALGASPVRLAAGLLAENLLLAIAGGALGVLLAWWGTQALQAWLADDLPRINPVAVNGPVLGFAVLLAAAAGLGFGLAPAWSGSRVDLLATLKDGGPQSSPAGHRWRQGLVALEVALALVLAVDTGLLVKSLYQLYAHDLGFRTGDVLTANLALPRRYGSPAQQREFATRWLDAVGALPGVKAAALTDLPPLSPYQQIVLAVTQGATGNANASNAAPPPSMAVTAVTPDFFRATGIALRTGRVFADQDGPEAPAVAVVNEAFVRQFYPGGLTLGVRINQPGGHGSPPATAAVVGVVADIRPRGFDSAAQPLAYFPLSQQPRARLSAVIQFAGDSAALGRAVVVATHRIDSDLALDQPSTLEQQLTRQTAPRRVTLILAGAFAATAILLAALGIFSVMSYTVAQRTPEISLRLALGATSGHVLRWMLRYGGQAIGSGLGAGLALTLATGRLLTALPVGVSALDPAVIIGGTVALAAVGLAACLLPAVRATRINPAEALRNE